MEHPALLHMEALAQMPDALEATIQYLTEKLSFLKKREKVLILFSGSDPVKIGSLMAQAVERCGAEPIFWEGDLRWKALLRLAFSSRATTVIGPPLIILGLTKLARARSTPLSIRNVITAGYPCLDWMIDGIIKGLDSRTWGCFDPGSDAVICGFSCSKSRGVHLRDDIYSVEIVDGEGNALPAGQIGKIVLSPKSNPDIRYFCAETARLELSPCRCGCNEPRIMDINIEIKQSSQDLAVLGENLLSWTSILDFRMERGDYGLELELVIFPGEKLPKLPSCARLVVRPWNPDVDEPFQYIPGHINPLF